MPYYFLNILQIANYTYKKCKIGANIAPISYCVYSQILNLMKMKKKHCYILVFWLWFYFFAFQCKMLWPYICNLHCYALPMNINYLNFFLMFSYGFY
jgi:hypothetical protein